MTATMDEYLDSPLESEDVFPCKGCGEILEEGKAFELGASRLPLPRDAGLRTQVVSLPHFWEVLHVIFLEFDLKQTILKVNY